MTTEGARWDATQTAVLDAVVACAEERGFRALTTKRVAEMAGVNEVTIFRRFGTKAQLIAAAFEREAAAIGAAVGQYTGDLEADLQRIVSSIADASARRRRTIPMILAELASNEEIRSAATYSIDMVGVVAGILQRYQAEGKLVDEPPLLAYAALVGPLVYLGIVDRLLPAPITVDAAEHVRRFLDGRTVSTPRKDPS